MEEIEVKIPAVSAASYTVKISHGILGDVAGQVQRLLPGFSIFVVTDANVAAAGHLRKLAGPRDLPVFIIEPPGEVSKNIATVAGIAEAMEGAALGRDTVLVALGGGTVGDIAGFAAGIFKRGVPVVHVPTTTVAQADSAIGGKTGVDSTKSKNAYGLFHHPAAVFVDVETLASLDARQFNAGLAESVKHGLIADAGYFEYLEKHLDDLLRRKTEVLEHVAVMNARIKATIVQKDPREKNLRRVLNYGHTIGHAVESASACTLLHGEAIAIGIVAAGMMEMAMGIGSRRRLERVTKMLERLGLPAKIPREIPVKLILEALQRDKKTIGGQPRFVLLDEIGSVHNRGGEWAVKVPKEIVDSVLRDLCR